MMTHASDRIKHELMISNSGKRIKLNSADIINGDFSVPSQVDHVAHIYDPMIPAIVSPIEYNTKHALDQMPIALKTYQPSSTFSYKLQLPNTRLDVRILSVAHHAFASDICKELQQRPYSDVKPESMSPMFVATSESEQMENIVNFETTNNTRQEEIYKENQTKKSVSTLYSNDSKKLDSTFDELNCSKWLTTKLKDSSLENQ
ncbi:unnamed protein product [Protopolystoma xenopodis]|uniref:Uncharacterized protein n=1 Tax=Protopolystoma xenopodis TaxID=117903 RepID=A0A3S5CDA6_9PLAT|nr:unnamed protein product [Protopolystoma xenopodis]